VGLWGGGGKGEECRGGGEGTVKGLRSAEKEKGPKEERESLRRTFASRRTSRKAKRPLRRGGNNEEHSLRTGGEKRKIAGAGSKGLLRAGVR